MSHRKLVAIIDVNEEDAYNYIELHDDGEVGLVEHVEREFVWLEEAGITLRDCFISDTDDTVEAGRYIDYLIEWTFYHSQDDEITESPMNISEWRSTLR